MIRPKQLWRLLHINRVLIAHGLDELILDVPLFRPLKFLRFFSPNTYKQTEHAVRGVRIRKTLEDLGPIFVKFGQTLSTRRDLLPEDIADELALLQDKVPPFPGSQARSIIEAELGKPIEQNFTDFDQTPLASASVAQVHTAKLLSGDDVIIKVLRPDIEAQIRGDIALLFDLAELAVRFSEDGQRLRPVEVVAEFEKTILDELDMLREAGNASQLRRNFKQSEMLYIPKIYWDLATRKILVMERIYGIPVGDVTRLKAANINFKQLAEQGVEIFFTQVFRDNFFHADMHPGNIFVTPESNYIAVDFGIVGSLTEADKYYLAENFLAFFNRDYRRVAELHVESGWVHPDSRIDEIESAVRTVCEPIFDKPLAEISYGHLLLRLFQIAQRFKAEVQPQLVLFQKTLLNIEGLGRELYPQLNLWDTAKPFLENWFKKKISPTHTFKKIREQAPNWIEQMPEFPGLLHRIVDDAAHGRLAVEWRSQELELMRKHMQHNQHRLMGAITGSALIIAGAILMTTVPMVSLGLGISGTVLLLYAWGVGSNNSPRQHFSFPRSCVGMQRGRSSVPERQRVQD